MVPTLRLRRAQGSPAALHDLDVLDESSSLWEMTPTTAAVVLGSAQRESTVDGRACRAAELVIERRRSGGGLVVIRPGAIRWLEVVIDRSDPRWTDDVSSSAEWVGEAWVRALETCDVAATVYSGPPVEPSMGATVCFAGLGSGEVVAGGRKVVGISQRRDRRGARFQCSLHSAFDAAESASLVSDKTERAAIAARLSQAVAELSPDEADQAVRAFIADTA
jgi:lipoate-protein ligase A